MKKSLEFDRLCDACGTIGIFEDGCGRCLARWYSILTGREKLQVITGWRAKYSDEDVRQLKALIEMPRG